MADEPRGYKSIGEVNQAKLPPFSVVPFSDYGVSLLAVLGPDGTVIQTFREDQASQAQQAAENRRAVHMASLSEVPDWMKSKRSERNEGSEGSESNRPVVESVPPFPTPAAIQPPPLPTPPPQPPVQPIPSNQPPPRHEAGQAVAGAAEGIVGAMYDMLWSRFQAGETTEAGSPSTVLQVARAVAKIAPNALSRDEFESLAREVGDIKGKFSGGQDFQAALRDVVNRYAGAVPSPVPSPPSPPSPPLGGVPPVGGAGGVPPLPLPPQVPPAAPSPPPQPLPQSLQPQPPIPPSNQSVNPPQPQPQFQQPQGQPQQPQVAPVFGPTTAPAAPLTAAQIGALFGVSPTVQPVSQSPLTGAQIAAGLGMQQPLPNAPSAPLTGSQIAAGFGMGPNRVQRGFQQAARRFRAVAPHAAAYGGFRGVARTGATALGAAFPEVAIPAMIITGIVRELADLPRELRDFAESIHAANRALIPFAPRLGIAEAQLQLSDLRRNMGMARDIEPTAVTLTGAIDEMREALYPFRVAGRNLQSQLAAGAAGVVGGAAQEARVLPEMLETIRQLVDPEGKNAARVGEAVGTALVDIFMPIIPLLNAIRGLLGIKEVAPGERVMDAWTAMLNHEAGPMRMKPLHGFAPFNPAERRPGEIWP